MSSVNLCYIRYVARMFVSGIMIRSICSCRYIHIVLPCNELVLHNLNMINSMYD